MINLLLKLIPNNFGRRAALLISSLAFVTVIFNLLILSYLEYRSSFKTVTDYINSQYEVMSTDISDAIITDDIYSLYSTIENVSKAAPYIDNIIVLDANGQYISDAKVTMTVPEPNKNIIRIDKKVMAGKDQVGSVYFYINKGEIISDIGRNVEKLFIINLLIIIAGTLVGLYLMRKMTSPLLELSTQISKLDVLEMPYKFHLSRFASSEVTMLKSVIENLSLKLKDAIDTINDQQKEISRSERLAYIGTMSAGLAHELKNPIMSINLILSNFADEVSENKQWQEDFVIIKKEADKLVFRINEFLEYSRPVKLNFECSSVFELIEDLNKSLSLHSFKCDIKFNSDDDADICVDREKIIQIADILTENSVMAGSSAINIDISVTDRTFHMTISDNGSGFKGSDVSKIMLPFYTTKKDGTGLGLAICATIIDAMGGKISAHENEPQGAVFSMSIPMPPDD